MRAWEEKHLFTYPAVCRDGTDCDGGLGTGGNIRARTGWGEQRGLLYLPPLRQGAGERIQCFKGDNQSRILMASWTTAYDGGDVGGRSPANNSLVQRMAGQDKEAQAAPPHIQTRIPCYSRPVELLPAQHSPRSWNSSLFRTYQRNW